MDNLGQGGDNMAHGASWTILLSEPSGQSGSGSLVDNLAQGA